MRAADRRLLRVVHDVGAERAPSWINECTLRSVEMFWEYEPGTYLPCISPTPLLMVVARGRPPDGLGPGDRRVRAGARAEEARDPRRRALRRLHRGLRALQRRGARLVRPAPARRGSRRRSRRRRRRGGRVGAPGDVRAPSGAAVRAGGAHQRGSGRAIRVPGSAAGDLDAVGEVGDQRHAEADARAVRRAGACRGRRRRRRLDALVVAGCADTCTSPGCSRSR